MVNSGVAGNINANATGTGNGGTITISNSSTASNASVNIFAYGDITTAAASGSIGTLNLSTAPAGVSYSNSLNVLSYGNFIGQVNSSGNSVAIDLEAANQTLTTGYIEANSNVILTTGAPSSQIVIANPLYTSISYNGPVQPSSITTAIHGRRGMGCCSRRKDGFRSSRRGMRRTRGRWTRLAVAGFAGGIRGLICGTCMRRMSCWRRC